MSDGEQKTTILGHLRELRNRIFKSAIAVIIGFFICFTFREWIFYILKLPARGITFSAIEMTENLSSIMLVCFVGGIVLAMPVLVYHGIMFVAPALTRNEKKWVLIIIPWIFLMFMGGVAFGYFLLAPWTIWFLTTFGSDVAEVYPRISNYIGFLTKLLLLTGLVFEMPVISTFLARFGLLKPEWLAKKRSIAIIIAFVAAAIITPPDPITQVLLAIPLILLYEMSIILARVVYRRRQQAAEAKAAELD
ncbi:MAG TPA: twin-arginine translocase subunit TatC [Dehalococcoidia bacterium]|nr:twin-arginine translocase subunit TatC [Dehalococcoidia bacterium]